MDQESKADTWLKTSEAAKFVGLDHRTMEKKIKAMIDGSSPDFVSGEHYILTSRGYKVNPNWLAGWKASDDYPVFAKSGRKKKEKPNADE